MRNVSNIALLLSAFSSAAMLGCSSSDAGGPQPAADAAADAVTEDATANEGDAGPNDAASEAHAEAAADADAGACPTCNAQYLCVTTPGGQQLQINASKKPDRSCNFGGGTLYCGGTCIDKNGKPCVWEEGKGVGPNGGSGIGLYVKFDNLQLNCE